MARGNGATVFLRVKKTAKVPSTAWVRSAKATAGESKLREAFPNHAPDGEISGVRVLGSQKFGSILGNLDIDLRWLINKDLIRHG